MPKTEPLTLRLSPDLDEWVSAEAKRTRRPKSTVIEGLAREALRLRQFPGIAFRGDDWDRRAWIVGTSMDVWEVVRAHQDVQSATGMAADGSLTVGQVRLALAYYERYPEEIDALVERDRRSLDALASAYPFIEKSGTD